MGTIRPYERPVGELDRIAHGATAEMHNDTALHRRDFRHGAHPGVGSVVWSGGVDATSVFVPRIRNFHRHLTRATLDHTGRGVQIFSQVTMGFPLVPEVSISAYTAVVASWPRQARATALTRWLWQVAWTYGQIEANSDRLVLAKNTREVVAAIQSGRVAAQFGAEGSFPFDAQERDLNAVRALLNEVDLPRSFPRPTERELQSRLGLLTYARRIGTQYVGLSHLVGSCDGSGGPIGKDEGLRAQGREMIKEMDRLGIMLDLAHASPKSQSAVIDMVSKREYEMPLIVSHGVLPVEGSEPAWRVTSPAALEAVRKTGGIVGIIGAKAHLPSGRGFLSWAADVLDWLLLWPFRLVGLPWHFPGWTKPMDYIDDMIDQMEYIRARIGIDHVGLGLDGDGFVALPYKDYAQMQDALRQRMAERGFCQTDIDKVFAGNYLHVLQRRDALLEKRMRNARATSEITLKGA